MGELVVGDVGEGEPDGQAQARFDPPGGWGGGGGRDFGVCVQGLPPKGVGCTPGCSGWGEGWAQTPKTRSGDARKRVAAGGWPPHRNRDVSNPGAPCEKASSGSQASISTILDRETLQSAARASRGWDKGGGEPAGWAPAGGAAFGAAAPSPPLPPPSLPGAWPSSGATAADSTPDPNLSTRSAASTPCSSEAASACPAPTAACSGVGAPSGIGTSAAPHCSSSSKTPECPPRAAAISAPCGESATWGERAGHARSEKARRGNSGGHALPSRLLFPEGVVVSSPLPCHARPGASVLFSSLPCFTRQRACALC